MYLIYTVYQMRRMYMHFTFQDHDSKMSDEHRDTDDSSEKTSSRMSRSPQKSSKKPKTVPVKVMLLDGSEYEIGVEVWLFMCLSVCLF